MTDLLKEIDAIIAREDRQNAEAWAHRHDQNAVERTSGGAAVAREIRRLVERAALADRIDNRDLNPAAAGTASP